MYRAASSLEQKLRILRDCATTRYVGLSYKAEAERRTDFVAQHSAASAKGRSSPANQSGDLVGADESG
jgi:hypothetical protein